MIGLTHYLLLGAALFGLGLFGLLTKRNLIALLMSVELMLNSVNINLVAFSRYTAVDAAAGQVFSLFIIAVAAAEVAVGLALMIHATTPALLSAISVRRRAANVAIDT